MFLQDIEYSSLCYTVGPCCLPTLYIIVCICSFQIPNLSLPPFPFGKNVYYSYSLHFLSSTFYVLALPETWEFFALMMFLPSKLVGKTVLTWLCVWWVPIGQRGGLSLVGEHSSPFPAHGSQQTSFSSHVFRKQEKVSKARKRLKMKTRERQKFMKFPEKIGREWCEVMSRGIDLGEEKAGGGPLSGDNGRGR